LKRKKIGPPTIKKKETKLGGGCPKGNGGGKVNKVLLSERHLQGKTKKNWGEKERIKYY